MPLRSQLPGTSPLTVGALAGAVFRTLSGASAAREELRALLGERFRGSTVLLGSGTQALQAALRQATSLPGLESLPVAVPAYSCYDILTACVGAEVRVLFYDIDPNTLTPDLASLDECLHAGARVVVAGNLYGFPLDWGALRSRVDAVDGFLIEDAAQGVGSAWNGQPGGTFGDATVLSFGRGKGWTGGGGGALLVRDPRTPDRGSHLSEADGPWGVRSLVGSVAHWTLGRPGLYGLPRSIPALALGETVYKPPSPPTPMAAISAGLVLGTAALAEAEIHRRRDAARRWSAELPPGPWGLPRPEAGGESSFLRFPVVTRDDSIRARLLERLERFGAAPGYPRSLAAHEIGLAIAANAPQRNLKGSRALAAQLLTLPTHSRVQRRDRREITAAFRDLGGSSPDTSFSDAD